MTKRKAKFNPPRVKRMPAAFSATNSPTDGTNAAITPASVVMNDAAIVLLLNSDLVFINNFWLSVFKKDRNN